MDAHRGGIVKVQSILPQLRWSCFSSMPIWQHTICEKEKGAVETMRTIILIVGVLGLASVGWADSNRESTIDRLDHAGSVLREIMAAPDNGIPEEVLEHARCVAVVPHMINGGFIFCAQNGRGVATCR